MEEKHSHHFDKSTLVRPAVWLSLLIGLAACGPSLRPPPSSPTPIVEPTKGVPFFDEDILQQIRIAKEHESISLSFVPISHITSLPWIDGSAYLGIIRMNEETAAILTSADCVFDRLRETDQLGPSTGPGLWRPDKRIDQLEAVVSVPYSLASPFPLLDLESITLEGKTSTCKTEKFADRLREFLKGIDIDWQHIPENLGELLARTYQNFLRGIQKGLTTPTPNQ